MRPDPASHPPRRAFLRGLGVLGLASASGAVIPAGPAFPPPRRQPVPAFPRNDLDRVRSVVGASHGNFDAVRELVTEQPALAKASWDWGFGDWESCLGAAAHTGRREIAEFLVAHGARPNLFSAAMMGDLDTVRAFLAADGELHLLHGPHGISLLAHARAGRDEASRVVDYLLDRFGDDEGPFGYPGDETVERRYAGRYVFDTDPETVLSAGVSNGFLLVSEGERPSGRVRSLGEDVFHPTGAPAVRLRFHVEEGRAVALTVHDGPLVMTGRRAG